ncbi:poly-beta-1,6 N-acetyl-D-glucosamine export porin PgaA [Enterobacter sp.]|uniref:poly-beta-1,6 N-acetyl-D-glucosamine export porin PgaA n=1 Tax=Enterobacter sp. TaxID=42895 RepID=UPI00296EBE90|nr:poly-beta-1,6 N-acetyl-D-glucosamine export porin PgaA [Enterobacter sp.]
MFNVKKSSVKTRYKLIAVCLASYFSCQVNAQPQNYNALVREARNGNTTPALAWFASHASLNNQQIADWLQIASWAGEDAQVISVYERFSHQNLPLRAYPAAAKAYRNQKRWSESLQLWKRLCDKDPANADYQRGYLLTLADSGDHKAAIEHVNTLLKKDPDSRNYLAAAWVYRLAGQEQNELFASTMAMQHSSSGTGVKEYKEALQDNDLSYVLLKENGSHADPDARAGYAAELVRLAFMPTRSESERYNIADRALATYQSLLSEWKDKKELAPYYRRALIDQMGALLARDRHKDVLKQEKVLKSEGIALPEYARYWVASAYLHEKKPQQAEAMLKDLFYSKGVLKEDVTEEQRADLFYSHLESNRFKSASLLTNHILKKEPVHTYMPGSPLPLPNNEWLQGHLFLAELHEYANDLPAAERYLRNLKDRAPGNQNLKIDYARVLMARGWPRKAEKELKKAEVLEPTNISLEVEQSYVAMALQDWRHAELLLADVQKRDPANSAVKELKRAHDIHHSAELRVGATVDLDSDSPDSGRHDNSFTTTIYTPPLAKNWRAFAGFGEINSHFTEGQGNVRDWSAGLEWRSRDIWMEGEIMERHFNHGDKLGGRFSARYDLNDNFSIGTQAERISHRTPARALKHGITANSAEANLQWQKNERTRADFSYSRTHFSDGNRRSEFSLTGEQTLWSSHKTQVNAQAGIYYGANKKLDTPYYNPQKTVDVLPALNINNVIYENYSTNLSQQFTAGAGSAWEKNHGSAPVTQVSYGQRFEWNDKGSVGAKVNWVKRPYDGKREHNLGIELDMTLRF